MSERDYEAEARAEGWVPAEEWKGDPEKHVDAETFVKRGKEILPIVNAKNRKLTEQVEALSKTIEELKEGNAQFRQFHDKTLQREKQERERLIQQLEETRRKAVSEGDGDAFDEADKKLNELRSAPKNDVQEQSPEVKAWLEDNPWYQEDDELQAIADGLSGVLAKKRPELIGSRKFLDELTKMVQERVPSKFENPNRSRATTEEHSPSKSNGKAKTYENLPDDARAACDKFVKTIPGFTKEQYVAEYEWD